MEKGGTREHDLTMTMTDSKANGINQATTSPARAVKGGGSEQSGGEGLKKFKKLNDLTIDRSCTVGSLYRLIMR